MDQLDAMEALKEFTKKVGYKQGVRRDTIEDVSNIVKEISDKIRNKVHSSFTVDLSAIIVPGRKVVSTLNDEAHDDVDSICIETVDYLKNSILKDLDDLNVKISVNITKDLKGCKEIVFDKTYTDLDIPEHYIESNQEEESKDDEYNGEIIKEIIDQNKEVIESILDEQESEDVNEDLEENESYNNNEPECVYEKESEDVDDDSEEDNEPEDDAYENESNDDVVEETPDYSSTFIPQPKDEDEIPVGATQVNNSYYNNNKKKNKHR